jgi:carboxyl-terminal processing protease
MTPRKKSILSAGAVVLACGALSTGLVARNQTDLHSRHSNAWLLGRALLASRSSETPDVSEGDFYATVSDLLKRNYVDPISDDSKLALGAIRGMVSSLENPDCLFMDPAQFKTFLNARAGKYEGIGVDLALEIPSQAAKAAPGTAEPLASDSPIGTRIPALVVASVVPGSPADKAGVKAGDAVDSVDGHWVLNPYTLEEFRKLQKDVTANRKPQQALVDMRKDLRKKIQSSMMPLKAKDRITSGTSGSIRIVWVRGGQSVSNTIERAPSTLETVSKESSGAVSLHFAAGAAAKLKSAIGGGSTTLDLRNNAFGDYSEMRHCLALLAPAGNYGRIANLKNKPAKPFSIEEGTSAKHPLTLLVDSSTRGAAEIFALALQSKGLAKLSGEGMSPNRNIIEVIHLPDGSGYTLVTGRFEPASQEKGGAA